MNSEKKNIPIFFACDDNYLPYLSVTLASIEAHASDEHEYDIYVLTEGFSAEGEERLLNMPLPHLTVKTVNVNHMIENIKEQIKPRLRDYYSPSIFYRIFIPSLFPELDKAIYLDCDIVLTDDIAKLFFEDIGDNILGAIADESIAPVADFARYVDEVIGSPEGVYINSGVLVINAAAYREAKIEEKIIHLINKYNFDTVAPDQDYLNFLCRGRIHYFGMGWNKQPHYRSDFDNNDLHLIHYNMFEKPWCYKNVPYEEHFWRYANSSPFIEEIMSVCKRYTDEERKRDAMGAMALVQSAGRICDDKCSFCHVITRESVDFSVKK